MMVRPVVPMIYFANAGRRVGFENVMNVSALVMGVAVSQSTRRVDEGCMQTDDCSCAGHKVCHTRKLPPVVHKRNYLARRMIPAPKGPLEDASPQLVAATSITVMDTHSLRALQP